MATENRTLSAPEEQVSPAVVAEDVQTSATEEVATNDVVTTPEAVDFAEEEAALAAQQADLEVGEETAEEAAAE